MMCMNYLIANESFKENMLKGDVKGRGASLAGIVFLGMFIGGIVTGAFGDKIGRRTVLLLGLGFNAVSGILAVMSTSFYMLSLLRFGNGIGIGAIISTISSISSEIAPPSRRGFFVTFVASFWTFGTIYTSLLALILFGIYEASWRWFLLGVTFPVICGSFMVYVLVPESARYLAVQGRHKDAVNVANWVATSMGSTAPMLDVSEVLHHYPPASEDMIEKKALENTCIGSMRNITVLYNKHLCRRTLMIQLIFSLLSFGSGLGTWVNTFFVELEMDSIYVFLVLFAIANLPGNILAAVLLDVLGRKWLMIFGFLGGSISLLILSIIIILDEISPLGVVISSCIYHCFLVLTYCSIYVMTSEIFPTTVRNTAMGMCTGSARLSAVATQFIYGALIKQPSLLLQLASATLAIAAVCVNFINVPDMTNKPLNDDLFHSVALKKEKVVEMTKKTIDEPPDTEQTLYVDRQLNLRLL